MDANRADIAELRHEMQLGFARMDARFEQVDARFEQVLAMMDARFVLIQTQGSERIEKALREQTRFFYLAWAVQLAAIVGLYSR